MGYLTDQDLEGFNMINWKPSLTKEDFVTWVVCEAVGNDRDLIKEMKRNADGSYPIFFSVGDVELDFNKVVQRMNDCFYDSVAKKAQELLNEKYGDLINEIDGIQEIIQHQKERFKYNYE